ncbi:hypothetical protein D4R42_04395 [bacterium]|nr:MAG: hypothetical protein D4R42_04395 [bacterium]
MKTPDLNKLLDEAPEVSMDSGARASVVDWAKTLVSKTDGGYFKIPDLEDEINADFKKRGLKDNKGEDKKIYYSQVLGWIRRVAKKGDVEVVKKRIASGPHKGIYYNILTKAPEE